MDVDNLEPGIKNILIKMTREELTLRYSSISEVRRDLEKSLVF